jgi:hypothetical protein
LVLFGLEEKPTTLTSDWVWKAIEVVGRSRRGGFRAAMMCHWLFKRELGLKRGLVTEKDEYLHALEEALQ